ncbi:M16 family metallopeptidase [Brytella acorum]|uniref:Pitrilysin family protein n=1 Tax=Brytella acorum TaxID=2959299 RepID=A0AA35Y4J9_9PROT|nr:pitrilysin family protein [Brytella acorum]MDF3624233.1 pitrilysin family protein [Brytella acorum]CAI9121193.1 pitrilysin family protein [Brytella acorum]
MSDPINVTRLPNGLTVVTERMERVETVSFGAYVSSGTRHETPEENGVSHFLEHMAFKGTKRRSAARIAEEIENVGGHINAYTAREQTAYYVKLLKEDLPLGIDIIGDILTHSTFLDEEVERERGVILQEIGQANDTPDDIVFDHFQETAYPDQPMGRPTLGTEALITSMKRETLMNYMHTHYTARNIVIAAAGNLYHEAVLDMVSSHFRDLPAHDATQPSLGRYVGGECRTTKDLDQAHIVMGFPSVPYGHPDYHATLLLSTLLGGGMSSRLFQEVREKRGLVYSVYSFAQPFLDSGIFGIYAGTGEEQTAELVPVVIDELRKLPDGIAEAEIARARAQLKSSLLMSLESTGSRCEQIARQLQLFDRVIPTQETVARVNAVTEADIIRVARQTFTGQPTLATIGPVSNVPSLDAIRKSLAA